MRIPIFSHPCQHLLSFFFLIYLFLVVLGLRCCVRAFSSCSERGLLFVAVCGFLIGVTSLVAEHSLDGSCAGFCRCGSQAVERRLSSCGTWAQLLHGMWDLPGPELEPASSALAGGLLPTVPPGKSLLSFIIKKKKKFFLIVFFGRAPRPVGSWFSDQGWNPCPCIGSAES